MCPKTKNLRLFDYQERAIERLRPGSILCGGVGSGKSITSLSYFVREFKDKSKALYVITTAHKRDLKEWDLEWVKFMEPDVEFVVDSWNNISKYVGVEDSFFIFDEQRLVSYGTWTKSFLKIAKNNNWILLTATPGDTWSDYIPVFIANGFYRNKSEFLSKHVVFSRFTRYPKIERYIDQGKLYKYRSSILVTMNRERNIPKQISVLCPAYDVNEETELARDRWANDVGRPIRDAGELCFRLRKSANCHPDRLRMIQELLEHHDRLIIFYNFNYELEILRQLDGITVAEYNGCRHDKIPNSKRWVYLVQYTAGAEGWNCIRTNCVVFYSLNYSYKVMKQAAGRIDRLNSPFDELLYFVLISNSKIDKAIVRALNGKKTFSETKFYSQNLQRL